MLTDDERSPETAAVGAMTSPETDAASPVEPVVDVTLSTLPVGSGDDGLPPTLDVDRSVSVVTSYDGWRSAEMEIGRDEGGGDVTALSPMSATDVVSGVSDVTAGCEMLPVSVTVEPMCNVKVISVR